MLYEISNNTVLKTHNLTVNDVFEDYIENSSDSYSTKNKHIKLYNKYINTKDINIQSLTKADIISNLNAITSLCSDDTIARVCSIYRNDIVLHALNNEYINRDLMAGIKKPKSRYIAKKKSTESSLLSMLKNYSPKSSLSRSSTFTKTFPTTAILWTKRALNPRIFRA